MIKNEMLNKETKKEEASERIKESQERLLWERTKKLEKEIQDLIKIVFNLSSEISKLRQLYKNEVTKKKTLTEQLNTLLTELGFSYSNIGREYIYASILYCIERKNADKVKVSNELYPYLGKKFNTSQGSIEKSMRYAIKNAIENDTLKLSEIFGARNSNEKRHLTNSEFLCGIVNYIMKNNVK